ncbi:MAG: hypothetical protein IJO59_03500 [Clostridia bacterium]|nr:hypothetical protein [Clostridia bacterium]
MSFENLPPIREIKPLDLSHFPSLFHAAVFRLWETVPAARIAAACDTTAAVVEQTALDMGLAAATRCDGLSALCRAVPYARRAF